MSLFVVVVVVLLSRSEVQSFFLSFVRRVGVVVLVSRRARALLRCLVVFVGALVWLGLVGMVCACLCHVMAATWRGSIGGELGRTSKFLSE